MKRLSRVEQQERTRAALIDAAERVVVARGFLGASVEAIAAEAGYTRGAFYSNFSSKEELFAALLQDRVYRVYRDMAVESAGDDPPTLRETGERLAAIQDQPAGRWLFPLWLELLAHATRDERFREIAAGFWRGNRALTARALTRAYDRAGVEPPAPADHVATALIALDIGIAVQRHVDPGAVPLSLYPELYELLFSPLEPPRGGRRSQKG